MFNIGFTELIILAVIGLLVIGPEQLPDLARKIARTLNELKRAKDELLSPVDEFKNEAHHILQQTRNELLNRELEKSLEEGTKPHDGDARADKPESGSDENQQELGQKKDEQ